MKGLVFLSTALFLQLLSAQTQFGFGIGSTRISSRLEMQEKETEKLLYGKTQTQNYTSYLSTFHYKNLGVAVNLSDKIYGVSLDYSKTVVDNVLNLGVGLGLNINHWKEINKNYKNNLLVNQHDAPLSSEYKTACPNISLNCDIRLYKNVKSRISFYKPFGTLGYTSDSKTVLYNGSRWLGETSHNRSPLLSISLYYSLEQKIRGPLIIDPEPKRHIEFE